MVAFFRTYFDLRREEGTHKGCPYICLKARSGGFPAAEGGLGGTESPLYTSPVPNRQIPSDRMTPRGGRRSGPAAAGLA